MGDKERMGSGLHDCRDLLAAVAEEQDRIWPPDEPVYRITEKKNGFYLKTEFGSLGPYSSRGNLILAARNAGIRITARGGQPMRQADGR